MMPKETNLFCLILSVIIFVAMTIIMIKHAKHSTKVVAKTDTFLYGIGNACCMFMVASLGALYFLRENFSFGTFALVLAATAIYGAVMGIYCTDQLPKTTKQARKRLERQALSSVNR